jgi:serine/threonine-protein kinase
MANDPYCWGSNLEGQLGDGTTSGPISCGILQLGCHAEPVAVSGDRHLRQMSLGDFHTCGVNRNGIVFCWGNNQYGQLGDGTESTRLTPTRVRRPV